MLRLKKQLMDGDVLPPWYYGASHWDFYSGGLFMYPIPINYLVRAWVWFTGKWKNYRCSFNTETLKRIKALRDQYYRMGYEEGLRQGKVVTDLQMDALRYAFQAIKEGKKDE